MSSTHRVHRLLRLITLLQSGFEGNADNLAQELGVSRRTLFRDLKMLEMAGIPYYHEPDVGYRIAHSFYLPPVSLTVIETLALLMLGKSATAQQGRPMVAEALSAINKLTSTVPEPVRQACQEMLNNVSINPAPGAVATEEETLYASLHRSIDEQRICKMQYCSRQADDIKPLEIELHPYALHFASRAWYVMGWTDLHRDVRTLKLTRIKQLEMLSRKFNRPIGFSAADKIGQAWELIPEGQTYKIELIFSPMVGINVKEVQWHPSQEAQLTEDGSCRMRFEVDGLGEIAWWLCGYADQVQIIKPKALRSRVHDMLHRATLNHNHSPR